MSDHSTLPLDHRLPKIPPLLPLEIPRNTLDDSEPTSSEQWLNSPEKDRAGAGSLSVSAESFTTARTSSSPHAVTADDSMNPPAGTQYSPTAVFSGQTTLHTLPKSTSIDSFVREQRRRRESPYASPITPEALQETPTASGSLASKRHSRLQSVDPSSSRYCSEIDKQTQSTQTANQGVYPKPSGPSTLRALAMRVKGTSRVLGSSGVPASEDDLESSPYDDSEFEQGHSRAGRKISEAQYQHQQQQRMSSSTLTPKRTGSVSVSRTSSRSSTPRNRVAPAPGHNVNLASINTAVAAAARSDVVPEYVSPPLRSKLSEPASLDTASRSRSYSVGTQSDDSTARKSRSPAMLHIDTNNPPVSTPNLNEVIFTEVSATTQQDAILMTLAIVGSRNCGKTSFIRRAWKNSLVSDPERQAVKDSDGQRVIRCECTRGSNF